jgi:hypothetical protein
MKSMSFELKMFSLAFLILLMVFIRFMIFSGIMIKKVLSLSRTLTSSSYNDYVLNSFCYCSCIFFCFALRDELGCLLEFRCMAYFSYSLMKRRIALERAAVIS